MPVNVFVSKCLQALCGRRYGSPQEPRYVAALCSCNGVLYQRSYSTLNAVSTEAVTVLFRWYTDSACEQPPRPTQPPVLSWIGNEYRPKGCEARQLGMN